MKTVRDKNQISLKQRRYRLWFAWLALVASTPILFYYGYCWGLWGRGSLLLQYMFQCSCPPASEEARYPDSVDVIISACRDFDVFVKLSPSGRYLSVQEDNILSSSGYLLDLQTLERIDEINQPFTSFLTDDLLFVEIGLEDFIFDLTAGKQYPIQRFVHSRPDAMINGETNLILLAESLQKAENVFLIGASTDTIIALTADYDKYLDQNFTSNRFDFPDLNPAKFLQENKIGYQIVPPDFPGEVVSPDRNFVARDDGIYLAATNQRIIKAPPSLIRGWTINGKGAIYSSNGLCLVRRGLPFSDDIGCAIMVPQPVIILKIPEEYLTPTPTP